MDCSPTRASLASGGTGTHPPFQEKRMYDLRLRNLTEDIRILQLLSELLPLKADWAVPARALLSYEMERRTELLDEIATEIRAEG